MGLDSVELLVAVEKTFDIEIPDFEAEQISTVGDLYESVWDKLQGKKSNKCKSAFLFYKFRRLLQDRYGISKKDFKLDSNINSIIPQERRKEEWFSIQSEVNLKLPELALSIGLNHALDYFSIASILGGTVISLVATVIFNESSIWWLIPIFGLLLTIFFHKASKPFKTTIRPETVRDFINNVLSLNYLTLTDSTEHNRKEMESVIFTIIQDRVGVNPSQIHPNAHFVKDLGID